MNLPAASELQQQIDEIIAKMSDPVINRHVAQMKELSHSLAKKKELFDLVEKIGNN